MHSPLLLGNCSDLTPCTACGPGDGALTMEEWTRGIAATGRSDELIEKEMKDALQVIEGAKMARAARLQEGWLGLLPRCCHCLKVEFDTPFTRWLTHDKLYEK